MRTLIIETSGNHGELALADENGILQSRSLSTARKHARDLIPQTQEMFRQQGWSPKEVELLAIDVGPGSYTGLRVGLVTVKAMAYVTNAIVIGVETPRVVAAASPESAAFVSVIIDAQQGNVYRAEFQRQDAELQQVGTIDILPVTQWAQDLPPGAFVTGPALDRYESFVPKSCEIATPDQRQPHAEHLWRLATARLAAGQTDDYWTLEPLYLRASSAEIKWDKRQE